MATNLTKRQIVLEIYNKRNHKQNVVREIVQDTLDAIQNALANGKNIELRKFGVFEIQVRKARVGRNPNRPETDVEIPKRAVVKFKAGKELKAALKELDLIGVGSSAPEPPTPAPVPPTPDLEPPKPDPSPFGGY